MKKIFYAFLSFLFFAQLFQKAIAQNTAPYWSVAGNSNATTSSKLGTTNSINVRLYTNNLERMRILGTNGYIGIGTTAPTDRLHINSAAGANALRVQVNGNTKLLVHSGGGVAVGANVIPPANGLYVAGKGRFITGLSVDNGTINVTNNTGSQYALSAISTPDDGNAGIYGEGINGVIGKGDGGTGVAGDGYVGVWGTGIDGVRGTAESEDGIGVGGDASMDGSVGVDGSSSKYYGVRGTSYSVSFAGVYGKSTGSTGYGVQGNGFEGVFGTSTLVNGDGIRGEATRSGAYGVLGLSDSSYGVYGSTGNTASYAGYFSGNVYATGTYSSSDRSLKKDITDVTSAMEIIGKLKPKSYSFKQDGDYKLMNLPPGTHYGLIAQDVEQVLPQLVKATTFDVAKATPRKDTPHAATTNEISFKALNYTELIPIVIKGMQELNSKAVENENLKTQVADLTQRIERLEALLRAGSGNTVSMTSLSAATPNPVKGSTRIGYSIPPNSRAQLLLTDAAGKAIKVVTLTNSGYTNLNTTGLSSGTYNYSLIVDGKNMDTKKLIIAR